RLVPRGPIPIPSRLDGRPIARILDVAHAAFCAIRDRTMQHNRSQPNEIAGDRRVDLDWVRIGAFGLLILYHVGMFYVPWSWHIKSVHSIAALEPLMLVL